MQLSYDFNKNNGRREIRPGARKEKGNSTHQLEVLNATDEIGRVGPSALNVHTICKTEGGREREQNISLILSIMLSVTLFPFKIFQSVKIIRNVSNRIKGLLGVGPACRLSRTNIKTPREKAGIVPTQLGFNGVWCVCVYSHLAILFIYWWRQFCFGY